MPWLHLIFDAYEEYKKQREFETVEREAAELAAAAERAVLEATEYDVLSDEEGGDDDRKKKKKKKHKEKNKDKHRDKYEDMDL